MKSFRASRHLPFWNKRRRPAGFVFEVLVPASHAPDLRRFLATQGVQPCLKGVRRILGRSRLTWLIPVARPTVIFSVSADELDIINGLARWYEQRRTEWPLLWVGIQPPDAEWRLDFAHHTPGEIRQLVEVNNLIRRASVPSAPPGSTPIA